MKKLLKLTLLLTLPLFAMSMVAQNKTAAMRKTAQHKAVSSSVPSGYSRIGTTDLYCIKRSLGSIKNTSTGGIDFAGKFGSSYYTSTYNQNGYRVAMKVGNYTPSFVNCSTGTTIDGVTCTTSVEQQATFARVIYKVYNSNTTSRTISLGTHADVMIGNNDHAPLSRKKDTNGNTYGLLMSNGSTSTGGNAQLCVLFGNGLAGVTGVDDFWFGTWTENFGASYMVGGYTTYDPSNWMVENGSYDSGMGWCWKNREIPAGAIATFSYLIAVGNVDLQPKSDFTVTVKEDEDWNDTSINHTMTFEGMYESPAGIDGKIQYSVDGGDWYDLTDMIPSGSAFSSTKSIKFNPEYLPEHIINFRTVDNVGNTTDLNPIKYKDISVHEYTGLVEHVTYTGNAITQTLACEDLTEGTEYKITGYSNNVNAGTATFCVEGIYPNTIGRKYFTFTIDPKPLTGTVSISGSNFKYNGSAITPDVTFSDFSSLVLGRDYTIEYSNNTLPGTATATVTGIGNYTGTLTPVNFTIGKGDFSSSLYTLNMPGSNIAYDGNTHAASAVGISGTGAITIEYSDADGNYSTEAPSEIGTYKVYLSMEEGDLYNGTTRCYVGQFTIYDPAPSISISLDENSSYPTISAGQLYDVTLARKLWQGEWNTLCLPFDMTNEEVINQITGEDNTYYVVDNIYDGVVNFVEASSIVAGKKYIVRPKADYIGTIQVNKKPLLTASYDFTDSNDYTMKAFFYTVNITADEYNETPAHILNGNKFYEVNSNVKVAGYHWYVVNNNHDNYAKCLTFTFDGNESTVIKDINTDMEDANAPAYNLTGIRVQNGYKGVVIKNGKKIIIK